MTDPIVNDQSTTSVTPNTQTEGIFGGSEDIFNNPDFFVKETKETAPQVQEPTDLDINFDDLNNEEVNVTVTTKRVASNKSQVESTKIPEVGDLNPETGDSKIVEPQMKPGVKVQPFEGNKSQVASSKIPEVGDLNPETGDSKIVEPQMKPGVKVQPFEGNKSQVASSKIPEVGDLNPETKPQPKPEVKKTVSSVQVPVSDKVVQTKPEIKVEPQPKSEVVKKPIAEEITKQPASQPANEPISDLKKKFDELVNIVQNIYKIEKKPEQELEILGADNDKVSILYNITLPDNDIKIIKTETDKGTEEEIINELLFVFDAGTNSVSVILDDVLLFDEVEHLANDPKKKMQVVDKLNKFIFLTGEHLKKAEKEIKEKEAEEIERRRLQDIFRNF